MLIKKDMAVPFLRALEKIASDASCRITIEPADINKIKFEKKSSSASKNQDEDVFGQEKNKIKKKLLKKKIKKRTIWPRLRIFLLFQLKSPAVFPPMVDFFEKLENMPYFIHPLTVDISLAEKKSAVAGSTGSSHGRNNILFRERKSGRKEYKNDNDLCCLWKLKKKEKLKNRQVQAERSKKSLNFFEVVFSGSDSHHIHLRCIYLEKIYSKCRLERRKEKGLYQRTVSLVFRRE